MPTEVTRRDVQRLVATGAQLVDVLDAGEYEDSHLPGAVNIPLTALRDHAPRLLDRARPTIAYCYDAACDLSPRAAWRLEALGFLDVYDYVGSKIDWMAAGLPFEGTRSERPHLGSVARRDVPTCAIDDPANDVRTRSAEWGLCVVVNDRRVVTGVVRRAELAGDGSIASVIHEAPTTYRPHTSVAEIVPRLRDSSAEWLLVTNLDGTLVGVASRADLDAASRALDTAAR